MSCLPLFPPPRLGLSQSCSLWRQTPWIEAARDGSMDPSAWVAPSPARPPLRLTVETIYRTSAAASSQCELLVSCLVLPWVPQAPGGCSKRKDREGCLTRQTTFQENRLQEQSPVWVLRSSLSANYLLGVYYPFITPVVIQCRRARPRSHAGPDDDRRQSSDSGQSGGICSFTELCGLREITYPF